MLDQIMLSCGIPAANMVDIDKRLLLLQSFHIGEHTEGTTVKTLNLKAEYAFQLRAYVNT